ncbi:D-alanyl-D-alanine carboxypeptidase family protein [Pseudochelatococcus lubricantis]|uniref:D-alanyl-D-alanine carboxypeptidase family protein n=1 Tax=Pseudochelatococcus lubricantis TaxID=1538102 RepID=UPI0035E819E9
MVWSFRSLPWRVVAVLQALVLVCLLVGGTAGRAAAQGFQTDLPRALLIDVGTGTVLFEKGADEPFEPASMAKIMTAEVLFHEIREGRLSLDKEFFVSEYAWRTGGAPSRSTAMFAAVNSNIPVRDLLRGLAIPSGNDAAIIIAEGISGTETAFTRAMNRRAAEIGLTRSSFVNASGLPAEGQVTTSRDLARLAAHVIATYPELYRVFSEPEFTWSKIQQRNRNPLLALNIGADGLLTGFTEQAGYGIVGSAVLDGQRLIVVVSGAKTARERDTEARKLLDWGLRSFEVRELFAASDVIGEAGVFGGEKGGVVLVSPTPVRVLVQRGSDERISARIVYRGPVIAPVDKGVPVGHLQVERGRLKALDVPLVTGEAVARGTLSQRALDAALEWGTGVVRRAFERLM